MFLILFSQIAALLFIPWLSEYPSKKSSDLRLTVFDFFPLSRNTSCCLKALGATQEIKPWRTASSSTRWVTFSDTLFLRLTGAGSVREPLFTLSHSHGTHFTRRRSLKATGQLFARKHAVIRSSFINQGSNLPGILFINSNIWSESRMIGIKFIQK